MGLGAALTESLYPYYPNPEHQPDNLDDYAIPTMMDIPGIEVFIHECPSTENPLGVKGIGEMAANYPAPAIINAIQDAVDIELNALPASPESILKALEDSKKA